MTKYLIGIDVGSTVCKAAVFSEDGREVAVAGQNLDVRSPHPGWRELDADAVWQCAASSIAKALASSGIAATEIACIGMTGAGNGGYFLDRDLRPVGPAILSSDGRAADIVADWRQCGVAQRCFEISLMTKHPGELISVAAWIKQHQPDRYARVAHLLQAKDYVRYRLTDAVSSDFSDMSSTGSVQQGGRLPMRYSAEALALCGVGDLLPLLPEMHQSAELVGKVSKVAAAQTGLLAGTPVAAGSADGSAAALGSGAVSPGDASINAGTWGLNFLVRDEIDPNPTFLWSFYYGTPGLFVSGRGSPASAANLEWFVSEFCGLEKQQAEAQGISVYDVCNELVASVPPSASNPLHHPFVHGAGLQPNARAGFYGLGGWHHKAHVLRAIYEGVAFGHVTEFRRMREGGFAPRSARLTGGAARSAVWSQIFSDALDMPIRVPAATEVAAHGAAIFAGIGSGIYADAASAVAAAVRIRSSYEPRADVAGIYRALFDEYEHLIAAMQDPWDRLARLKERPGRAPAAPKPAAAGG